VTRFILLVLIAGCSSGARPGEASQPVASSVPETAAAAAPDVASFITPEVTGVIRTSGKNNLLASEFAALMPPPPDCWTKLTDAIGAAYQLEISPVRTSYRSYYLIEGALPRDEVEACLKAAFADLSPVTAERDGELGVFHLGADVTVYAAWRGSIVIAGSKELVTRALRAGTPEVARTWRERLSQMPTGPMAMWRADVLLASLSGASPTNYIVTIDRIARAPRAFISGRILARYGAAGDAAIAARRLKQGELHLPDNGVTELADAFRHLKVSQAGTTLELAYDLDLVQRLVLGQLELWLQLVADAAPAARP